MVFLKKHLNRYYRGMIDEFLALAYLTTGHMKWAFDSVLAFMVELNCKACVWLGVNHSLCNWDSLKTEVYSKFIKNIF